MEEVINLKTIKPVRGLATVELFDSTGKKIKEVKSENMITTHTKNHLKWDMKEDFFRGCPGNLPAEPTYCLDNIALTTANITPTDAALEDAGVAIGWCNKAAYSGSDIFRGTLNTAESYASNDKVHWVFDWPTHSANGTFQTIVWGRIATGWPLNGFHAFTKIFLGLLSASQTDFTGLDYYDGFLWTNRSGLLEKRSIDNVYEVIDSFSMPSGGSTSRGFCFGGDFLWHLTRYYVYKIDPSDRTVVDSIPTPEKDMADIIWKDGLLWLGNGSKFFILDPISKTVVADFIPPVGCYKGHFTLDGNSIWVRRDYWAYKVDLTSKSILNVVYIPSSSQPLDIALDEEGALAVITKKDLVKIPDIQIGAKALLPQPITKTSDNTMKVTYEFIFEE